MRGFEWITEFLDLNRDLPQRKTKGSAGYDLAALDNYTIPAKSSALIATGLKAYMQDDEVLLLFIRSSVAIKKNLRLINGVGVIDSDYYNNSKNEGHILIAMENQNDFIVHIEAGEFLVQGIFTKFLSITGDTASGARLGGIGSTNRIKE